MNRFTRLTALLLALMMILSTFAAAETAYQVGDMTTEQWNSIVQNAQSILNEPVINKGGDVIDYPPETPTPSTPYDKTIEVTLGQNQDITTANLAVVKSNVADQWQIAIKDDLWVNILGEDGNTLNVNAAMLQGTALKVRQAGNDAQVTAFTVFEETAATMQSETTKFSVEPREGTTADTPMTVEDANPDIEKFALQIVYRTAKGIEMASPYTASFVNGSSYSTTVPYPDVQGYTPQLSTSGIEGVTLTDNGDSLTYSFTKLTPNAPIQIVVQYNPAEVTYDVNHYQQNADDDGYTLVATETLTGYTEAQTMAAAKQYDGFYALLFDQPTIAADGSTDVNIYYDRHYYLMNFELSGGYGVEPIYARYGAEVGTIDDPTRLGYTFDYWSPEIPDTVPLDGGTYTAIWIAGGTTYNVLYWQENANDSGYSFFETEKIGATAGAVVSGSDTKTYEGFHFDHADTNVTVAGDGSTNVNVYYKRNTYTLTFAYEGGPLICTQESHTHSNSCCKYGGTSLGHWWHSDDCCSLGLHTHSVANGCYGIQFTGIKYGQATDSYWAQAPALKWKVTYSGTTFYTNAPAMPNGNLTIYGVSQSGTSVIHYYEYVNGEETTISVHPDYTVNTDGWTFTEEDYIDIPGFTFDHSKNNEAKTEYFIYYTRNSYTITFHNGKESTEKGPYLYESDISGTYFVPTYTGDNPDAYTFGGWYTTEECLDGTEFVFTGAKMPYNHLILYAKWESVSKNVTFYLDLPTLETNGAALGSTTVPYGTKVAEENIPAHEKTGYKFVGWFYVENGEEKAFDFANMPVTKDLEVYGKWTSDTMVPYRVRFVYVENGVEMPVAADEIGSAPGGSTKTFDAKVGAELKDEFQTGYFPTLTKSHNVPLEVVKDANGVVQEVVYTFYYYKRDAVPYIVYYVDSAGNKLLDPYVNTGNVESIVSETFKPITGYMPDEFQKSLVVNGDNDTSVQWITVTVNGVSVQVHPDNVITFVYSKNDTEALYVMSYYMEELDGSYTLYARENAQVGTVDQEYSNKPLETVPEGFSYEKTVVVTSAGELVNETTEKQISAVLTTAGLEFKHYYKRNLYPYTVHYYKQGTTESVYASKTVSDNKYGQKVPETARDLTPAYSLVSLPEASITIGTGENVIIFEYAENDVLIQYEAVGLTEEQKASALTSTGETLPAVSGNAEGSIAKEILGYTFDGWYTDEACENAVGAADGIVADVTDPTVGTKFTPLKEAATEQLPDGYYSDAVFYAKYTENTATITYKAVCKVGDNEYTEADTGGTVNVPNNATPAGAEDRETVTVVTGTVAGATAKPTRNYEFLGWFTKDDNGKYVAIENGSELEYLPVKGDIWQDATYYALFELDVADLTITKTVNGAPAGIAEQEFAITVSLPEKAGGYTYIKTLADKSTQQSALTTNGGTLNIKNGETIVIKDVAIGSQYSVTETEPSYFTVTGEVENAQIGNGENKVSLINTYKSGQLSIAKTVQAAENVDVSSAVFTFTVTLDPAVTGSFYYTVGNVQNSATFNNGVAEITLKDGETATFETLPNGVEYTVTEQLLAGYVLDENKTSNTVGKITNGTSASAVFTNIHRYGNLVISKTVSGEDAPGGEFVFNITLNDGALTKTYDGVEFKDGKAQVVLSVAKNETKTAAIIGLPAGTTYTVTEAVVPGYTTTITEATTTPGSIDPAGTDTVAFANEYKTGILTIKKMVATAAGVTAPKKDFAFIVTLKDASGHALTGSYAYTIDNGGTGGNLSSGDTITLKHDQTATFGKLPDGVTFEVVETADTNYVTTATPNGSAVDGGYKGSGTISADNAQAVEFTNFYNYGNLTITKNVEGAPADLTEQEEFNAQISGLTDGTYSVARSAQSATETLTVSGGKGTLTIKHGETLVIENIKDGTKVTVTEIDVPSYYEAAPASGSVTIDADATDRSANTVAITNTYKSGSLTITKTVVGVTAPDQEFTFTVDIDGMTLADNFAYTVATANVEGTTSGEIVDGGQLTLKNGQTATISGLPVGVNCTVTEQAIVGNPYTTEVKVNDGDSTTASAATVAIPESGAGAVEFINTYQYSDLKISKTVVNASELYKDDLTAVPFTFTVTLTVPDGASLNKLLVDSYGTIEGNTVHFTLKDGETATIKNIPVGTTYTVAETPVAGYTTKVAKNNSTPVDRTAEEGTIAVNTVDMVAFTNTYSVGRLTVTKTVVDKSGMGYDLTKDVFTFTVNFSDTVNAYTYTRSDNTTGTIKGTGTITLKHGETATFDRIPAGVIYKVTESETMPCVGYKLTASENTTGEIGADKTSAATFENTYYTGTLTIIKTGMQGDESAIFTVNARTKDHPEGRDYTIALSNNESVTIKGLVLESSYSVTENGGWSNRYDVTSTTKSSDKIEENGTTVTITNEKKNNQWLHDESVKTNVFSTTTNTTEGGEQ